jgi:uncharacterized protein YidB (DUF937 family)
MGILDNVIGMLGNNTPGGASSSALVQQMVAMVASNASAGGLGPLVQSFDRAGLGHIVGSWIGTGQNLPISPDQLTQVLGQGKIAEIAGSLGMQTDQVAAQLSQLMPHLIDRVTPGGQIPANGIGHTDIVGALASILGQSAPPSAA